MGKENKENLKRSSRIRARISKLQQHPRLGSPLKTVLEICEPLPTSELPNNTLSNEEHMDVQLMKSEKVETVKIEPKGPSKSNASENVVRQSLKIKTAAEMKHFPEQNQKVLIPSTYFSFGANDYADRPEMIMADYELDIHRRMMKFQSYDMLEKLVPTSREISSFIEAKSLDSQICMTPAEIYSLTNFFYGFTAIKMLKFYGDENPWKVMKCNEEDMNSSME